MGAPTVMRWVRHSPVSLALAALIIAIAVADGSLVRTPRSTLVPPATAAHEPSELLPLLAGVLVTHHVVDLLLVVAALVLVVSRAERLMGSGRLLIAYVGTALAGVLGGLLLQAVGFLSPTFWTTPEDGAPAAGAFTPIVGTLLAASAFAGPLWRRRLRLLGLTSTVVVLLYSGQPGDVYRLLAAFAGLALGLLLARRQPRLAWPRSSHHEVRSLLASMVAVGALGPFVAVFDRRGYGLLRPLGLLFRDTLPGGGHLRAACRLAHPMASCARDIALTRLNGPGAVLLTPLPLIVLLVAAFAMWRGRRLAAVVGAAVNGLLAVLAAVYYGFLPAIFDPDQLIVVQDVDPTLQTVLAVAVPAALAVAVLATLRHFEVLPDRRALRGFLLVTGGTLVAVSVVYVAGGLALANGFDPHVGLLDLLGDLPERFVPVGFLRLRRLDFVPTTTAARLLWDWVGPVFWLVLLGALAVFSLSVRSGEAGADLDRIKALLRVGSSGSLGWMTTWRGNRYWFSADGRNALAYREVNGVALTVGEPVGAADGAAAAAQEFAVYCDDQGLTPVFYAVQPTFAETFAEGRGWPSVVIAEDTVLHPATFSMRGKRWQDVRTSFNRADRLGIRAVWTDWDSCSITVRSAILAISEEWVADRRLPELGFTLGGIDELRDPEVKLMLAVGPGDHVEAVTSWLPTWRDGELIGWTLEFMRRRPGGMNGVMEFLIASVALAAQQRGLEFVSLSAAPLAVSEDPDSPLDRALAALARILEPAYGFASLASFKAKFSPRLQPLVMAYPDPIALPAIGVAVARAYLPELTLPDLVRLAGALR